MAGTLREGGVAVKYSGGMVLLSTFVEQDDSISLTHDTVVTERRKL